MADRSENLAVALFSEILAIEQISRSRVQKVLPQGMELSHFTVLNHLAHSAGERTPAQLARSFHLTRGAMTNTIAKLNAAGYIHIRPDWDDARRKLVSISPAGREARDRALAAILPTIREPVDSVDEGEIRNVLPVIRALRQVLAGDD